MKRFDIECELTIPLAPKRPCGKPHSITSSVMARSPGGTSMPSSLGGLQVDDELELGRLHDRQVGGLGALEDVAGIDADLTKHVRDVGSVAHQPAGCDKITIRISRRNPVARRQGGKLHAAAGEECVGSDEEGIGALARKGGKGRIDLAGSCWR